jgi:hypothetical protein
VDWLTPVADWNSLITLTFDRKDKTHPVTKTEALFSVRRLIQTLNIELFGKHYVRKVGHSYFPYILGMEHPREGLLHCHLLTARRLNYSLIIENWYKHCGYAMIEKVDDKEGSVRYVCKYVVKGGSVDVYIPNKIIEPKFKPMWYIPNFSTLFHTPIMGKS